MFRPLPNPLRHASAAPKDAPDIRVRRRLRRNRRCPHQSKCLDQVRLASAICADQNIKILQEKRWSFGTERQEVLQRDLPQRPVFRIGILVHIGRIRAKLFVAALRSRRNFLEDT